MPVKLYRAKVHYCPKQGSDKNCPSHAAQEASRISPNTTGDQGTLHQLSNINHACSYMNSDSTVLLLLHNVLTVVQLLALGSSWSRVMNCDRKWLSSSPRSTRLGKRTLGLFMMSVRLTAKPAMSMPNRRSGFQYVRQPEINVHVMQATWIEMNLISVMNNTARPNKQYWKILLLATNTHNCFTSSDYALCKYA